MSWIDDNKGQGPWDFTEQPNKWGYLNNPRWQTVSSPPVNYTGNEDNEPQVWEIDGNYSSGDSKQHVPCGHWHKRSASPESGIGFYSTGENDYGQLALDDTDDRNEFTLVSSESWTMVECGAAFVAAIKNTGTLWVAGQNTYGQLGLNDTNDKHVLTQVGSATWLWVTCLNHSMLAVKSDGTLWSTGYNNNGELGQGDTTQRQVLTQVGSATDWAKITGGNHFAIATKTDGSIYGTGENFDGELGLGDQTDRHSFTLISSANWTMVNCGSYHTLGIKNDGTLWACGVANSGQTGLGAAAKAAQRVLNLTQVGTDTNWSHISGGQYHSCAVKTTGGTLWGTGSNYYGQLGLGNNDDKDVFTQADGSGWEEVYTAYNSSFALKTDGSMYSTGSNYNGALGLGDNNDRNGFTLVGSFAWEVSSTSGNNCVFAIRK